MNLLITKATQVVNVLKKDGQMNCIRNIATFEGLIGIDDVEVNVQSCRCIFRVRCKTKGAKPGRCIFDTFSADMDTTLPDIGNGIIITSADENKVLIRTDSFPC